MKFIQNTAKGGRDILAEAVKEHGAEGISKAAQLAAAVASGKVSREDLEVGGKSFVQSMKKIYNKKGDGRSAKSNIWQESKKCCERCIKSNCRKRQSRVDLYPVILEKTHLRWGKNSSRKRKGGQNY